MVKNDDNGSSRFHLIPECHGQTDGQTDSIAISISRVSVLTRNKNSVIIAETYQLPKLLVIPTLLVYLN